MLKSLLAGAALAAGAMFAASPASAMTIDTGVGAGSGSAATPVAWYCGPRGHCVQGPRPGYAYRRGWAPGCGPGWRWDGWRCVGGPVIVGPPAVVVRPPAFVAPRIVIRP